MNPAGAQASCPALQRPARLLDPAATVHGLRGAGSRVVGRRRLVDVWLYREPPAELADPARWTLTPAPGGARVTVTDATIAATPAPRVELTLAGVPDTGRYRLAVLPRLAAPGTPVVAFDPLRTCLPVRLRPECPDLDACFPDEEQAAPVEPGPSPVHDYLARDWSALRAALAEFLVREDPGADLSPAEPTVAVLELFAHLGDLLHYRLDRVATEAYLETARLRRSVRRHAALVDYRLAEAAAASVPVLVQVAPGRPAVTVTAGMVAAEAVGSPLAFTLEEGRKADSALGEIPIYDWGEDGCWLPRGATECVLVRPLPADPLGAGWLKAGDLLAFEVVDPGDRTRHARWVSRTAGATWPAGTPAQPRFRDPLPSRRAQVVRLTEATAFDDPLAPAGMALTLVRWAVSDALARPYPVGIDTQAGGDEVAVARANLMPAHHGRLVDGPPGTTVVPAGAQSPPAAFSLLAAGIGQAGGAGVALRPDGAPHRLDLRVVLPSGAELAGVPIVDSLLTVPPATLAAVLEIEEHEPPVLRFRTGSVGLTPPLGSTVAAAYEVGGGAAGNLAANALRVLERNAAGPGGVPAWQTVDGVVARNPVPAAGGRDAAGLAEARRDAPQAFAARPRRALLAADHAAAVSSRSEVQRATAAREWAGSWPLVRVAVDLLDDPGAPGQVGGQARVARLQALVDDLRMLGTETVAVPGAPVGLLFALEVCARPGVDPEALRRRILALLRPGEPGRPGLFHPSRLVLGGAVHSSSVLAAVAGVPGVDAVELREARRLSDPAGTVSAVLRVGPAQVAVLDDDPARPERGRLDVRVRGGR